MNVTSSLGRAVKELQQDRESDARVLATKAVALLNDFLGTDGIKARNG